MATNTPLPEKMDLKTLSHVVSLRQKEGLHIDYQHGYQVTGKDWDFQWPDPKYDGCSLRVFIYNRVNTTQKVRMAWYNSELTYFGSIIVQNTSLLLTYGNGSPKDDPTHPTNIIPLGKFFSIGFRMDGNCIRPLVNDWVGGGYDMGQKVTAATWPAKIFSGENFIVSLHVCDEVGGSFPSGGLGQNYFYKFVNPIGSYVTVFAVFTGGTPDGQKVRIGFTGATKVIAYKNVSLKPNEEFRIRASNTFDGWLVVTSLPHDTEELLSATPGEEKMTNVTVSNNCYIRRILAVSGPVPERYRRN